MKHDEFQVKGHRFENEIKIDSLDQWLICTTTRALLRVNLRGAFSVCIKRMMGGRVIEENIDFYRCPICQCMRSLIVKIKKHSNQFTMPLLFCVILFYRFFLVSAAASVGTEQMSTGHLVPLYFPLSEFVNLYGKI